MSPGGTAEVGRPFLQPFLRNLDDPTALPGDKSPGYCRVIPPGLAKNQTVASPTFNHTLPDARRDPLFAGDHARREAIAFDRRVE